MENKVVELMVGFRKREGGIRGKVDEMKGGEKGGGEIRND